MAPQKLIIIIIITIR